MVDILTIPTIAGRPCLNFILPWINMASPNYFRALLLHSRPIPLPIPVKLARFCRNNKREGSLSTAHQVARKGRSLETPSI